jgi:hypothetical protein
MSNMVTKITVVNDVMDVDFSTGFAGGSIGNKLHANLKDVQNAAFTNNLTIQSVEVNDLLSRFGDYIKPVTPLNRELVGINKCLFGRISIQSSLAGNGGTADALMNALTGNIGVQMADGRLVNAPAARVASSSFASLLKTDKLGSFDNMNIRNLGATIRLAGGRALFDDLKIQSDLADWAAKGSVGFDALMDMAVSTRLNRELSAKLQAAEGALKNAAKGALGNTKLAGAAGMLDQYSIPRDREGRIPIELRLTGPVSSPKPSGIGFGKGETGGTSTDQPASPKQQVQERVQQEVKQVQQAVEEKKQEVQQQVEQKKEEAKEEAKKVEEQAKEKIKGKLKGLKF